MSYKIKEIPISERPRERLKEIGSKLLSDKEILSIILKTGTKDKNVTELAIELLKEYPLFELKNISLNKLIQIKGIGEVKAVELLAAIELGRRIFAPTSQVLKELENAQKIFTYMKNSFLDIYQEQFFALYFDTKRHLIGKKLLFIGTLNESVVHPREIFKEAYRLSASYIICIHNHPSNDTTPSAADIEFTEKVIKIGYIQGIPIMDHIIIRKDNYYSFYEKKKTKIKEQIWKNKLK